MQIRNKFLLFISSVVALVILTLHFESIMALFAPTSEVWEHIRTHLLAEYIRNTFGVMFFTMTLSAIIGTILAYGVSCYEFPLRRVISTLLYLPMAIPTYIGAHVFVDLMGPGGYIFNLTNGAIPFNSFWMAVFVFTTFYFPYVFITVKGFISRDMSSYIENARILGRSEWRILPTVIFPIAKTAIVTGAVFVGLEVLGDFGAVNYLNLHTFSTAIFKSWFALRDLDSALRLSGMVIVPVFFLLFIKGLILRFRYQSATNAKTSAVSRKPMKAGGKVIFYSFAALTIGISLALPLFRLITWSMMALDRIRWDHTWEATFTSLFYTILATLLIMVLGFMIATYTRTAPKFLGDAYGKITLVSYALPGPVVAIVVLFFSLNLGDRFGFGVATTAIMLVFGYVVRYLGIAYENIENGYKKLGMKHHQVARTLGKGYYRTLLTVDLPMLKPFLLSGAALVFIDLIKELPLTLALRPFNFHTLATQAYQFASNEMLPQSGVPSLIIIAISMILTVFLFQKNVQ